MPDSPFKLNFTVRNRDVSTITIDAGFATLPHWTVSAGTFSQARVWPEELGKVPVFGHYLKLIP